MERLARCDRGALAALAVFVKRELAVPDRFAQGSFEAHHEIVWIERLLEVVSGALLHRCDRTAYLGAARHNEDLRRGRTQAGDLENRHPVSVGKVQVKQHRLELRVSKRQLGGSEIANLVRLVPAPLEQCR